ncbi:MAG TPA: hypothetical protein DCY27_10200 [Desulfobacterales bacterium]|nr:hypothetical protein [Desulfobacterales bacterium]
MASTTLSAKYLFLNFLVAAFILTPGCSPDRSAGTIKVFSWTSTPQARNVIAGLEKGLARSLSVVDIGADYPTGVQLVRQLASERLQLLVVLGTQALMLTAPEIKRTPVVFAMVADPYHTGAAYDKHHPEDHQENITGIASPPPLEEAIRQGLKLFPARRHWGLIYDPYEGSSVELQQNFADLAQKAGLTLTVQSLTDQREAAAALEALEKQKVQVVFIPPDQNARRYSPLLLQKGAARCFVVVNGNPRIKGKGAVLSVTLDYEAVGRKAADLANRLLAGAKPASIPIVHDSPVKLTVDENLLSRWAGYPPANRETRRRTLTP